eukprot:90992-Rhodomonas_salina.4
MRISTRQYAGRVQCAGWTPQVSRRVRWDEREERQGAGIARPGLEGTHMPEEAPVSAGPGSAK